MAKLKLPTSILAAGLAVSMMGASASYSGDIDNDEFRSGSKKGQPKYRSQLNKKQRKARAKAKRAKIARKKQRRK